MPPPVVAYPIIGVTPFEHPDPELVGALCRAGALGILDLGRDPRRAREALQRTAARTRSFGVRLPEGTAYRPEDLPAQVNAVLLPAGAPIAPWKPRTVLVQVTSLAEAEAAKAAGADGIVAKGNESGGRVGEETAYVLGARLVSEQDLPVWIQGGIGRHSAAAAIAGGARGVLLDAQLALLAESSLPEPVKQAVAGMDGTETTLVQGYRVFTRPDLTVADDGRPVTERLGLDLKSRLLPAGSDASLAKSLAQRWKSAAALVAGLKSAIEGHLADARAADPIGPGSALAALHHLRYPIFQGPMTRVSDRALFADEIAKGGGLPFLALSLMRGDEARALLQETKALLGDKPWGVGILGFVPAELREAQLAAIAEVKPPVALIAGGRPSQARPLEDQGIATYLHVPSAGLLDLFLADGARRFIFEGRECGGHVGPRSSFVLWEQQLERLSTFEAPEELCLVFAGGIHDARTAAMAAAMAGPLAARGAKIGLLMGTAYLFTEEAVATGAIEPAFQDEALRCERTVLLETAPGHATRCVETDYVRAFSAEKLRLEAEGKASQEVWAQLEQLNLGRLRIAAKGVKREGDKLLRVDVKEQQREGMYMIGQVAAAREHRTTIAALHREVSEGGAARLATVAPERPAHRPPAARPADVAIVGMAAILPGAADLAQYWANVVAGKNCITEVPKDRWSAEVFYDKASMDGEKTPSRWGGFLPDTLFDPLSFGITPRSLSSVEPVQLLALEVARRALEDAGYGPSRGFGRERTSVIFGAEAGTDLSAAYGFRALYRQYVGELPEELAAHLPKLTEDSFAGVLSNVIAGRIANRLDLGGVNYTVDAACASSLAAVDLAVKELMNGSSDMVLCGAADLHNGITDFLMFASVHALSPVGQCKTFDASADGIVLGEGVACLVLKRLADAERDGDRIYAVIKGVGGASDGKALGLTAPRKEGQMRAVARAYAMAGISPAEVGLVEAHGTGTVVGDKTELATLTEVFGRAGARAHSVALGSVKSQIGHTKCCAGLAGIIKASLALHHKVLPPTSNVEKPNPYWDPKASPFVFDQKARPWPESKRRAGVSAFGFGGTNFHVVLAEHGEAPDAGLDRWPSELFLFRGKDRAEALLTVEKLAKVVAAGEPHPLPALARGVASRSEGPVQIAVVATDLADLGRKLEKAKAGAADDDGVFLSGGENGKLAFLFPGQGSQRPGMLSELFVAFPRLQRLLELGAKWQDRIFPSSAFSPEEREQNKKALTDTRVAQPALGVVGLAAAELLADFGIVPDALGGHSYGELVALCVAGALSEADLLALSEARAECILGAAGADPGAMAAVAAGEAEVERVVGGGAVTLANLNAPDQTVISGPTPAVEDAQKRLSAAGLAAQRIPVACAFHSPVVAGARQSFGERLRAVPFSPPRATVFSNTTGSPYPTSPDAIRARLAEHVALPVRFKDEVEAMWASGVRIFVEAGPGQVLTGLVKRILGDRPHLAVSLDRTGKAGLTQLQLALGALAVRSVAVDPAPLWRGRHVEAVDLEKPRSARPPASAWVVTGQTARPLGGEVPVGGLRPITGPLGLQVSASAPVGARDTAVAEYLRSMREVVDAQKQVMLRFLGESPGADARPVIDIPRAAAKATPVPAATLPAQAAVAAVAEGIATALLNIVSERTGYPAEMLNLDSDMEAELSIDSIKRIEILGALSRRLGLGTGAGERRDEIIEQLAPLKTLRGIVDWLEKRQGGGAAKKPAELPAPAEPAAKAESAPAAPAVAPPGLSRFRLELKAAPAAEKNGHHLAGKTYAIFPDDAGVAAELAKRLGQAGAKARILAAGEAVGKVDGLVHLAALTAKSPDAVKGLFEAARQAVLGGALHVVGATGLGGAFGRSLNGSGDRLLWGGVAGLLKTLQKEFPEVRVRAVDLDPSDKPAVLADELAAELDAGDAMIDVGYLHGLRQALSVVEAPREKNGGPRTVLDESSVVLVTGGARGITARLAVALAQKYHCCLELVGRSPLPAGAEDAATAAAKDLPALRQALLAKGLREPAAIESECARILAAREIRATLAALEQAGAKVGYHSVDVRDEAAFGALIDRIYQKRGRIDGVIHGAGVLEDKLIRQKTGESFARVFDTKVAGMLAFAKKLRRDVKFVATMSSVSGVFGNRGQVDYSAANDAVDKLAHTVQARIDGRVVSIAWGPWAGGMVGPELMREYERRGIGLIAPEEGVASFLDEIDHGQEPQVILMNAGLAAMSGQA